MLVAGTEQGRWADKAGGWQGRQASKNVPALIVNTFIAAINITNIH